MITNKNWPILLFFMNFSPRYMGLSIALSAMIALSGALIGQYGFNLHPCDLCIYQRIPFVIAILLGGAIAIFSDWYKPLTLMSAITFLINSGIAAFHSGVERKWWAGLSGCSTPDMSGSIEELLKRIQSTDVVRCDEIPWDFMGLSMANYNVAYCLCLCVICALYLTIKR